MQLITNFVGGDYQFRRIFIASSIVWGSDLASKVISHWPVITAQVEGLAGQVQCKCDFWESSAFHKVEELEESFLAYKKAN